MDERVISQSLNGSSSQRVSALQAIMHDSDFKPDGDTLRTIERLLTDGDYGVKFWARKVHTRFTKPVDADNKPIQTTLPDNLPVEILIRKLNDAKSIFVAMEVIRKICESKNRQGLVALFDYRKQCKEVVVLSYLAKMVGQTFPGEEVLDFLFSFLKEADERVIANALEGIDFTHSPRCIVVLTRFLEHPNNRIKSNAALALAKYDFDLTYNALQHMLWASSEPHLAISACYAIRRMKDERFLPLLRPLLSNDLTIVDCLKSIEAMVGQKAIEMLQLVLKECVDEDRALLIKEVLAHMTEPRIAVPDNDAAPFGKVIPLKRASR